MFSTHPHTHLCSQYLFTHLSMFLTPIYTPFHVLSIHLDTHLCCQHLSTNPSVLSTHIHTPTHPCSQHPSTQPPVVFSTPKSRYTKCYQIPEISLELLLVISPLAHTWMHSISTSRLSSLFFFFLKKDLFIFILQLWVFCFQACLFTMCMPVAYRD